MKTKFLFLVVLVFSLSLTASAQTVIQNTTYSKSQPTVVSGSSSITATPAVTVNSPATVVYQATSVITLGPGFSVAKGGKFYAAVAANLDAIGDGIPDIWEMAYGLNPADPAIALALAADASGLSNLQEYLLGTTPNSPKQSDTFSSAQLNYVQTQLKINKPQ